MTPLANPATPDARPVEAVFGMLRARAHDRALVHRMARNLGTTTGVTTDTIPYLARWLNDRNETGLGTAVGLWGAWHLANKPNSVTGESLGTALAATGKKRRSYTATHTAMQRLLSTPPAARRHALAAAVRLIADSGISLNWIDLAYACTADDWNERTRRWARDYFRTAPIDA